MGVLLIAFLVLMLYIIGYICFTVFLKKGKLKLFILAGYSVPIVLVIVAFISVFLTYNLPIKSTDLSGTNINGYQVHQKISDEFVQSDLYKSKYEVYTHDDICDLFHLHTDDSLQIMLYKGTGQVFSITAYPSESGYTNQVDDLILGKSTYGQVVEKYGSNYRNIYFSDTFHKVIIYEDSINKLRLVLCFVDSTIRCVVLESL